MKYKLVVYVPMANADVVDRIDYKYFEGRKI